MDQNGLFCVCLKTHFPTVWNLKKSAFWSFARDQYVDLPSPASGTTMQWWRQTCRRNRFSESSQPFLNTSSSRVSKSQSLIWEGQAVVFDPCFTWCQSIIQHFLLYLKCHCNFFCARPVNCEKIKIQPLLMCLGRTTLQTAPLTPLRHLELICRPFLPRVISPSTCETFGQCSSESALWNRRRPQIHL